MNGQIKTAKRGVSIAKLEDSETLEQNVFAAINYS